MARPGISGITRDLRRIYEIIASPTRENSALYVVAEMKQNLTFSS
jgi:hypothetical protein